jgi:regulator of protease activity HflC (stomatin/prohibitin superfamily)
VKRGLLFALLAVFAILSVVGCTMVPPGEVGIKVYLLGQEKGVQQEVLTTGRYHIGVNQQLFLYPIFVKQYSFTKSPTEGRPTDEAFYFQTKDGNQENVDVAIQCQANPQKVSNLFVKYRTDMETIIYVNVRSYLRDLFNKYSSNLTVDELYGPAKMKMLASIQDELESTMGPDGLDIKAVSFLSNIRFPDSIEKSINDKNVAVQQAMQRENEVATAKAQADIKIAEARGEAESNRIKMTSITADTIKWQQVLNQQTAISKWDGKLPTYLTPNTPLPFIGVQQ